MYAAFSITELDKDSLSFSVDISVSACLRFLSAFSFDLLLLSHVLSRVMVLFIDADNGVPDASLFEGLMIVDNPLSYIVSDVGAPVLVVFTLPGVENDFRSGPDSCDNSEITNPHFLQNLSPVVLSVIIVFFPQRLHIVSELMIVDAKILLGDKIISYNN